MGVLNDVGIFKKIAALVSDSAPLLGSVLGSPFAGVAVGLLAHHFALPPGSTATDLLTALEGTSNLGIQAKQLEDEHAEALSRLANDDRASARARQVALRDWVPTILALGFLGIYSLIQVYCVIHEGQGLDVISARLQDVIVMIVSYYFGSSHKLNSSAVSGSV